MLALPGMQHMLRSGLLMLRVRAEEPVKPQTAHRAERIAFIRRAAMPVVGSDLKRGE